MGPEEPRGRSRQAVKKPSWGFGEMVRDETAHEPRLRSLVHVYSIVPSFFTYQIQMERKNLLRISRWQPQSIKPQVWIPSVTAEITHVSGEASPATTNCQPCEWGHFGPLRVQVENHPVNPQNLGK